MWLGDPKIEVRDEDIRCRHGRMIAKAGYRIHDTFRAQAGSVFLEMLEILRWTTKIQFPAWLHLCRSSLKECGSDQN